MKDVHITLKDKSYLISCTDEFTNKLIEWNYSLNQVIQELKKEEEEIVQANVGEAIFLIGKEFGVEVERCDNEIKLIRLIPSDNILM